MQMGSKVNYIHMKTIAIIIMNVTRRLVRQYSKHVQMASLLPASDVD